LAKSTKAAPSTGEFVALAALLISLVAMSIDAMLPALGHMAVDLQVANANDTQLVVSAIFVGLAVAQMVFGPLSDSLGRKPVIYLGLAVFCAGCAISMTATSFTVMLVGRFLQGIGAAGPRIVTIAVVRDQYKGAAMARIMSIVMAVFIIVPAAAPALGQGILYLAHWRTIFALLLAQGVLAFVWFAIRQPETLALDKRLPLSPARVGRAIIETCTNRTALGYTFTAGFVFGAFLGYLSSAQQIFQVQYGVGAWFPAYFGGLALALGLASIFNARMVMRFGMYRLSLRALWSLTCLSLLFLVPTIALEGDPPLWALMVFLVPAFFCVGILFGNFNALAMEPMGHIAGTAALSMARSCRWSSAWQRSAPLDCPSSIGYGCLKRTLPPPSR
jgi:DHA1 family bicyclomycin/chloramphenicol resistance-like MFS transporter